MPRVRSLGTTIRRGGGVALALLMGAGCQKTIMVDKSPRTQFENYRVMRQQFVPLEEPDPFGTPKPALRARLSTQSQ